MVLANKASCEPARETHTSTTWGRQRCYNPRVEDKPQCTRAKLLQHIWVFCDHMNCSPPGFSVCGVSQARIWEWIAMPFSRDSSWPQGSNLCLLCLLHWQAGSLPLVPPGKPPSPLGQSVHSHSDPVGSQELVFVPSNYKMPCGESQHLNTESVAVVTLYVSMQVFLESVWPLYGGHSLLCPHLTANWESEELTFFSRNISGVLGVFRFFICLTKNAKPLEVICGLRTLFSTFAWPFSPSANLANSTKWWVFLTWSDIGSSLRIGRGYGKRRICW